MPEEIPIITGYHGVYFAVDPLGRRLEFERRYSACFIVTLRGKIRFRYEGGCVTADPAHPVFLPQGLRYVNECLESAESYVFNFYTLRDGSPAELSAVTAAFAEERYQLLKNADGLSLILRELYTLSCALFSPRQSAPERSDSGASDRSDSYRLLEDALGYMRRKAGDSSLTVREVAVYCHVSEGYLRKLFREKYGASPFRAITDLRMKKARLLAEEKRPVKEIALAVGYSDVFQFSRAYKKYYGHPPSTL